MYRFRHVAYGLLLFASVGSQSNSGLVEKIQRCSQIDNSEERLLCYDELGKAVRSAENTSESSTHPQERSPETLSADAAREQEQTTTAPSGQTAEELFGFEHKQAAKEQEKPDRLYVEVSTTKKDRGGYLTIYLTNGQVWRQTGNHQYYYRETQGRAYLERGLLNNFLFSQENINRRIGVKRLQ